MALCRVVHKRVHRGPACPSHTPVHHNPSLVPFRPSHAPPPHPAPLQCHRTTRIQKRKRATYHIDSIDCLLVSKILEEPGDDCCNSENTSSRATFRLYQSSRHRPLSERSVLFEPPESVVRQDPAPLDLRSCGWRACNHVTGCAEVRA